ncbi:hypothetical protein [Cyclobacterium jeungdonense]|uniref:HEAT repeat domain-containing protein n=1 Tax=Cyclobacterium jeungdonense TaxID=708087 RepID=A0ABT8C7T3_9BACT|nr:hypothetical protein [Cyclobacterium jeungdonense]MDN3688122.1 hypothetical protein [Cyclobacterium jeungdonense]
MENKNEKKLKEAFLQWDGTHTAYLKNLYQENREDPSFIPITLSLFETEAAVEVSSSWVLKHHVDQGGTLSPDQVAQLLNKLDGLRFWESRLHLLQVIPKVALTAAQAEHLEPTVRSLLSSERAFVKAAAFAAYFEIVELFPELKNEFRLLCEDSLDKVSASVRVKIRRILKHLQSEKNG